MPIWITFMRAAIAGKDDEEFLADERESPMDQAVVSPKRPEPAALMTAPPKSRTAALQSVPMQPHESEVSRVYARPQIREQSRK